MNDPGLIGIMGPPGAGKDTAGAYLQRKYDYKMDSFAAPIYAGLATMLDVSEHSLHDRSTKEKPHPKTGVSPRRMLQTLGTEWGRTIIDMDIWLDLAVQRHLNYGGRTVITDVRFPNEVNRLKLVEAPLLLIARTEVPAVSAHASEDPSLYNAASYIIYNDGSFADLERKLDSFMEVLRA